MLMQLVRRVTIGGLLALCVAAQAAAGAIGEQNAGTPASQPRTVREYLAAIERAHEIIILLHPAVRLGGKVNGPIEVADAEAALRTLLRGHDFFFQYAAAAASPAERLQRVWVFPRGTAEALRIVGERELTAESSRTDLSGQLGDALARSVEEAQGVAARALEDPDENVRHQALEAILREALPVPQHLLDGLFLGDPSDTVRAAAFDALVARSVAEGIDVTATVDRALQDPSALVHDRAVALLESLGLEPPQVKPGGGK